MRYIALGTLIALFSCCVALAADTPLPGKDDKSLNTILAIAKEKYPNANWDPASLVASDVNCDSKPDYGLLGYDGDKLHLLVVFGELSARAKTSIATIAMESMCGTKAGLSDEELSEFPIEEFDGLEGYIPSKSCRGLDVSDGMCDSFHFYWNNESKTMSYWRM